MFFYFQDIDHGAYVRQAFEAASLSWFLEILQSDILINSDVSLLKIYLRLCLLEVLNSKGQFDKLTV